MKIQDKEELQYKQYQAANDKDGVVAAKLRKKLIDTMSSYGLLDAEYKPADSEAPAAEAKSSIDRDGDEDETDKLVVDAKKYTKKEKSLNKLDRMWKEAEASGLSVDELKALKEEFAHYQEKVDMYYSLFDDSAKNRYASMYTCYTAVVKLFKHNMFGIVLHCLHSHA